jgi:RNase H-like domain found in reverse transcriptase
MDSMTLAFLDSDKRIRVLTDASDRFYAVLVTQIDEEQLGLPMEEQDNQPLAFLLGEFIGAQLRWTVPEKKGFTIVDTVKKVDYLLLNHDKFSILSDHLNLTYICNSLSADPTLARHVVHKLQRWALKMSVFSYRMEHVMGELNYWTDLMTRWGVEWVAGSENKAHGKMASLFAQPYISPPDKRYGGVSVEEGNSTGAAERCRRVRALPERQRDGWAKGTAAASRCWRHENDEQCTMDSRVCSRAASALVLGGALSLCRAQSVRSDAWRNQGVCVMDNDG